MLNEIIKKISKNYLIEARNSPALIEDMAAMEKYMAESYNGRIFIELLQNADDCNSKKILVKQIGNNIIFANNGREFDENDVIALSRSGASNKERGQQIGYRGIGFKSTSYLTDEIVIYSNKSYFTFSKKHCANILGKSQDKIPTIRIPFLVEDIDINIKNQVDLLVDYGYTSVFIFKDAKIADFEDELNKLDNGYFMFLRNIEKCKIKTLHTEKSFSIERRHLLDYNRIGFNNDKKQEWIIISNEKDSIAFKFENDKIKACSSDEAIYHCFLPTLDKSPYLIKINSDFSTDPSRKHIVYDNITKISLNNIANLIAHTICMAIDKMNPVFSNIFELIGDVKSFSQINQILVKELDKIIKEKVEFRNNNGKTPIKDCNLLPDFFENSEKKIIRTNAIGNFSKSIDEVYYEKFPKVEEFIKKYTFNIVDIDEIVGQMTNKKFVSNISPQLYAKAIEYIAKKIQLSKINNEKIDISDLIIPTNRGLIYIKDLSETNSLVNSNIKNAITNTVPERLLNIFCNEMCIPNTKLSNLVNDIPKENKTISPSIRRNINNPIVSRWRSAEQQCCEIEKCIGNKPVDVSKQNVGYDIESLTYRGEKRYIEVKLITHLGGSFSMTNNEYTAAHQYGDNYYLCIIVQSEKASKAIYIQNPLKKLSLEKRIRQWEWYCDSYISDTEFDLIVK